MTDQNRHQRLVRARREMRNKAAQRNAEFTSAGTTAERLIEKMRREFANQNRRIRLQ